MQQSSNKSLYIDNIINSRNIYINIFLVFLGAVCLGISSHIYIPMYPVPFTLQSMIVLIIGFLLGRNLAFLSITLAVFLGVIGLPFFTLSKIALLTAPSFGYIVGFAVCAYVMGYFAEKGKFKDFKSILFFSSIAHSIIFIFGIIWLAFALGNIKSALIFGLVPFIGGFILKVIIASTIIFRYINFSKK